MVNQVGIDLVSCQQMENVPHEYVIRLIQMRRQLPDRRASIGDGVENLPYEATIRLESRVTAELSYVVQQRLT